MICALRPGAKYFEETLILINNAKLASHTNVLFIASHGVDIDFN